MKKYLLLLLFAFVSSIVFSQTIHWDWATTAGGGGDDYGKSITTDINGSILITGPYNGIAFFEDTILQTPNYNPGIFISKYDSIGNLLWAKDDYSLNTTYSSCIVCDNNGSIFIIGDFSDTLLFDTLQIVNTSGSLNSFLLKLNQYGESIFLSTLSGNNTVYGINVDTDVSGNIYIGGIYIDSVFFDSTYLIGENSWETYIAKLENDGNLIWMRGISGPSGERIFSLSADNNSDVLVTGTFITSATFGDTTIYSYGNVDAFIAKYLSSGELIWAHKIGGTATDVSRSLTNDSENNVFVYGIFMGTATFGDTTLTTSDYDMFITKLNPEGEFLWTKMISMYFSSGDEGYQHNMVCDSDNNLYVTGWFLDTLIFDDYTIISTGVYDSFVFKVDPEGNPLWAMQITGTPTSSQYSRSIDIDNSGNLYITGRVHETSYFDSISVTSFGGADVFIAKLHEEPVSVEHNVVTSTIDISVFPIPATYYINIDNPALQFEKAEIVSINSNMLRTYDKNLNQLDVSGLSGGVYLLRLYEGNVIFVKKIIIH